MEQEEVEEREIEGGWIDESQIGESQIDESQTGGRWRLEKRLDGEAWSSTLKARRRPGARVPAGPYPICAGLDVRAPGVAPRESVEAPAAESGEAPPRLSVAGAPGGALNRGGGRPQRDAGSKESR